MKLFPCLSLLGFAISGTAAMLQVYSTAFLAAYILINYAIVCWQTIMIKDTAVGHRVCYNRSELTLYSETNRWEFYSHSAVLVNGGTIVDRTICSHVLDRAEVCHRCSECPEESVCPQMEAISYWPNTTDATPEWYNDNNKYLRLQ